MRVARRRSKRQMSEINVVPYIDVMLVLLVIFMVTAPLMMEGVRIELPEADAQPVAEDRAEPFVVHVDKVGSYYLNEDQQPVTDPNEIRVKASIVLRSNPKTPFLVRGDRAVEYDAVVKAMVLLQQAGVPSVGLVTESTGN
ncbi:MAG: protein TolR [Pseudomonadota bacterium]|nr:protein TolR [Pseudomonadota bacterium]